MNEKLHPEVKKFFKEIGHKGGIVKSEAKTKAVKQNGKLGGRPCKINKKEMYLCKDCKSFVNGNDWMVGYKCCIKCFNTKERSYAT